MTELKKRQLLFSELSPKLDEFAHANGYGVTYGEFWRSDEQAAINALREDGRARLAAYLDAIPEFHTLALAVKNNGKGDGIIYSVHCDRLARDSNLMNKDGDWITDIGPYKKLGDYWKTLHPLCRWGGDFRDANHYSVESPEGRK